MGVLLGVLDLLALGFFFGFAEALADPDAFELGEDFGDAVGDGSGVGQTRASPVSLLTMRCASDSDSAAMPAATCSS